MAEEIENFLKSVNPTFAKYAEKLTEQGLTSTEELSFMQDDDFKHIGVPLFHWRKIVAEAKKQFGPKEEEVASTNDTNTTSSYPDLTQNGGGNTKRNAMMDWGSDEVSLFIRTLNNGEQAQYAKSFETKGVDGEKLLQLQNVKQLTSVCSDIAARYAIWEAVQDCKEGDVPSIPSLLKKDKEIKSKSSNSSSTTNKEEETSNNGWGTSNTPSSEIKKKNQEPQFVKSKQDSAVRQRLLKFYEVYNPTKLDDVAAIDELLRRYQGREQQLFSDLETKYILSGPKTTYIKKKLELKPPSQ
eukprot:44781_1